MLPDDKPILALSDEDRARFWSLVDTSGGPDACHPWMGGRRSRDGRTQVYGRFFFRIPGRVYARFLHSYDRPAHHIAYVLTHGVPPPDFPYLAHTCATVACCNTAHMRPLARGRPRTESHCIRGHEFTKNNTYQEGNRRKCLTCRHDSNKRSRAALVAAASANRLPKPSAPVLQQAVDLFGTLTDTAKVYGVSDVTIRNWCDDYGVRRPQRPRKRGIE